MTKRSSNNRAEIKKVEAYLKKKGIRPISADKLKTEEYKKIFSDVKGKQRVESQKMKVLLEKN